MEQSTISLFGAALQLVQAILVFLAVVIDELLHGALLWISRGIRLVVWLLYHAGRLVNLGGTKLFKRFWIKPKRFYSWILVPHPTAKSAVRRGLQWPIVAVAMIAPLCLGLIMAIPILVYLLITVVIGIPVVIAKGIDLVGAKVDCLAYRFGQLVYPPLRSRINFASNVPMTEEVVLEAVDKMYQSSKCPMSEGCIGFGVPRGVAGGERRLLQLLEELNRAGKVWRGRHPAGFIGFMPITAPERHSFVAVSLADASTQVLEEPRTLTPLTEAIAA